MAGEHVGDDPPDAAEADDHRLARAAPLERVLELAFTPRGPLAAPRAARACPSSGVIVRPSAVTICQKAAVSGRISCAAVAEPRTISVVSDGEAISTPVSAATAGAAAVEAQQRGGDDRFDDAGPRASASEDALPVREHQAEVDAHSDGDQENAEAEPAERAR